MKYDLLVKNISDGFITFTPYGERRSVTLLPGQHYISKEVPQRTMYDFLRGKGLSTIVLRVHEENEPVETKEEEEEVLEELEEEAEKNPREMYAEKSNKELMEILDGLGVRYGKSYTKDKLISLILGVE